MIVSYLRVCIQVPYIGFQKLSFKIHKLEKKGCSGNNKLQVQYSHGAIVYKTKHLKDVWYIQQAMCKILPQILVMTSCLFSTACI